jgi:hypothetical protein
VITAVRFARLAAVLLIVFAIAGACRRTSPSKTSRSAPVRPAATASPENMGNQRENILLPKLRPILVKAVGIGDRKNGGDPKLRVFPAGSQLYVHIVFNIVPHGSAASVEWYHESKLIAEERKPIPDGFRSIDFDLPRSFPSTPGKCHVKSYLGGEEITDLTFELTPHGPKK